jgi:hypothetical protein
MKTTRTLKRLVAACLVLATAHATPAWSGLELAWKKCAAAGGDSTVTLDCRSPDSYVELQGTFMTPDTIRNFVALGIALDFETEASVLPPFWHFEPQGCNQAGVTMSDVIPSDCRGATNIWGEAGGDALSAVAAYAPEFEGHRNRGRMIGVVSKPLSSPVTLLPGVRYYAFTLRLFTDQATEAGGRCAGCHTPVRISWGSAILSTAGEGEAARDIVLTETGAGPWCVRLNGARTHCTIWPPPRAWVEPAQPHDHDH